MAEIKRAELAEEMAHAMKSAPLLPPMDGMECLAIVEHTISQLMRRGVRFERVPYLVPAEEIWSHNDI